jgi:hypothetical protein
VRRNSALTYRGALIILGHHDQRILNALDAILGGVLLVSPAAGVFGAAAALTALWGWIGQKNEAISLVRKLLERATERIGHSKGVERHQLIVAAHTTIVASAFFSAFRERLGKEQYDALELTINEMLALSSTQDYDDNLDYIKQLYNAETPMPSATRGFAELCESEMRSHFEGMTESTEYFLDGLQAWRISGDIVRRQSDLFRPELVEQAIRRYADDFRRLAADVPEFYVWSALHEHAATRRELLVSHREIADILRQQGQALHKTEQLLRSVARGSSRPSRVRENLYLANRSALRDVLVPTDSLRHVKGVTFPTIEEIYVSPRYQLALYDSASSRPADDKWWDRFDIRTDLELFLAGHLMGPESTELPLLILGHPGAGKSLLAKLLGARLPVDSYTVVRVQLRGADAEAPIYVQIQQGLDTATHSRVEWRDLTEDSSKTIRVIILDGLDELIQATSKGRAAYLHDVAEFQRREADLERPVAVVVTSRTVLSEQVRIPSGSIIVRLREFDDEQVARWLRVWNRANSDNEQIRTLNLQAALRHRALASQPLLLMMLALYAADPSATSLGIEISGAELYGLLLGNFYSSRNFKESCI